MIDNRSNNATNNAFKTQRQLELEHTLRECEEARSARQLRRQQANDKKDARKRTLCRVLTGILVAMALIGYGYYLGYQDACLEQYLQEQQEYLDSTVEIAPGHRIPREDYEAAQKAENERVQAEYERLGLNN